MRPRGKGPKCRGFWTCRKWVVPRKGDLTRIADRSGFGAADTKGSADREYGGARLRLGNGSQTPNPALAAKLQPHRRPAGSWQICPSVRDARGLRSHKGKLGPLDCTATWLGSFTPSAFRTTGPTIASQISPLDKLCLTEYSTVSIRLVPINAQWELKLNCDKIR